MVRHKSTHHTSGKYYLPTQIHAIWRDPNLWENVSDGDEADKQWSECAHMSRWWQIVNMKNQTMHIHVTTVRTVVSDKEWDTGGVG